jgi:hypothetical protein
MVLDMVILYFLAIRFRWYAIVCSSILKIRRHVSAHWAIIRPNTKHGTDTFSECTHYGIPYCLQNFIGMRSCILLADVLHRLKEYNDQTFAVNEDTRRERLKVGALQI